jgi:hypothetical protein
MGEPTEAELRAAFGPRSDYYLAQWRGQGRSSYNRAAFFFPVFWLAFRRMYAVTAVVTSGVFVGTLSAEAVFRWLGCRGGPRWFDFALSAAVVLACRVFGNGWYLNHARRLAAVTRAKGLPDQEHLAELSRRGGTSVWRAAGFVVLLLAGFLVLLFPRVDSGALGRRSLALTAE